jgi:hypothetical protein
LTRVEAIALLGTPNQPFRLDRGRWHLEELGRAFILSNDLTTHLMNGLHPQRSIITRTRENNSDRTLFETSGD